MAEELKIEELAEGTGRQAMAGDTIAAHYTCLLYTSDAADE